MKSPWFTSSAALVAAAMLLAPVAIAQTSKPAKPAAKKAPSQPLPPIYDTDVLGAAVMDHSLQVAAQVNRQLFVNFGTNDCKPCRAVNKAIHDPSFYEFFVAQFVPVFIDADPKGKSAAIIERFELAGVKLPAVLIFDPKGRLVETAKAGELAAAAAKGPGEVQAWIASRFVKAEE